MQLDKGIPGSNIVNQVDKILHAPEKAMQDGLNAVGKGIEHLGNEIGMFCAHLKQDAIDKANGFLDWLLALAEKYLPLAVAAVFGMMMLAAAVVLYVPKMIAAMFRRRRPARKTRVRHA